MKIAIAGYGIEGRSNLHYWNTPENEITIIDESDTITDVPDGVMTRLGHDSMSQLSEYDLVIRTASLPPNRLASARKIWSATNEFFAQCPAPIIGVTGTKGKGTTCSLIASILRSAGKTVHLVGNIGVAALDVLPSIQPADVVVFEMSSFQLWDLEKSPHVAVVLMIESDHLDVHTDMGEYLAAKSQIAAHQSVNDTVIYHATNRYSTQVASVGNGKKVRYGVKDDGQVYVELNTFCIQDQQICGTDVMQIPGTHNLENACAAMSAALAYDQSITSHQMSDGLRSFTGLPHRLKFIREFDGVRYFDDSIATTPGSAVAAIQAFEEPKIIILGGSDKGSDYLNIVDECKNTKTKVVAIGETGNNIAKLCRDLDVEVYTPNGGMKEIVAVCQQIARPGSVVLLSPASASFGMFKSYSDRGAQFISAVAELPG